MAWRFVKQPNGLFARFSEVVDNFTDYHLTGSEATDLARGQHGMNDLDAAIKVMRAERDEDPYSRKTRVGDGLNRFREAIAVISDIHGLAEAEKMERLLTLPPNAEGKQGAKP